MAKACLLRIDLHFGGCRSLKEKRRLEQAIDAQLIGAEREWLC